MNNPILHREFLEVLKEQYQGNVVDLLGQEGLGIIPYPATFRPTTKILAEDLVNIFYTIDFLEKENLIKASKIENSNPTPRIMASKWKEVPFIEDLEYVESLFNDYHNVKITVSPKFFEFSNSFGSVISYEFDEKLLRGTLKIKNFPDIPFRKGFPALLVCFFYLNKDTGNEFRDYREFNKFIDDQKKFPNFISFDDFNKRIDAINRRIGNKTSGMFKKIISKGENDKVQANIYRWNEKII